MDFWEILKLEPTSDKTIIHKAYSKLTLIYHPEEYPDEFQKIHAAYLLALKYSRKQKKLEKLSTEQTSERSK